MNTAINKKTRLEKHYREHIVPSLQDTFKYPNVMSVPKLLKITLNAGLGEAVENKNVITNALEDLKKITGRKAVVTKARVSISTYKIRVGMPIGVKVTLRGDVMYEFLDRLISIAIPRIRDFRGLSNRSFDGRGNYSFGIKEQIIFPEIDYDKIDMIRGLDICISSNANTDQEMRALLQGFSFPLRAN
ncbi:MAG: 50S ribosomal protein L5 [Methylacidiphilales bacterium]|nr:50S ribosomal protein L5 [Candidatus Methylacidiphilales bacterium]